jgi:hypothetical protein
MSTRQPDCVHGCFGHAWRREHRLCASLQLERPHERQRFSAALFAHALGRHTELDDPQRFIYD